MAMYIIYTVVTSVCFFKNGDVGLHKMKEHPGTRKLE